ncbi:Atxe2 family lasso peptide isopeptidase [Novosphingobium sp.]|uniref:Atxe2 family lasso peptide isopeptidase n=1 Tax=Novosphingobium sp. TaxID=1874826 RepID=UPI00286DC2F4|nr:Atxe2 family lasso peptide isopeptidase [Novosphingobium sp.]
MGLALAVVLSQATLPVVVQPIAGADPCARFDVKPEPGGLRPVSSRDLAELTDIGRSDPNEAPSPFGVSPDGKEIAFLVRRGNPDANAFCQRLLVKPLRGPGAPREVDRGGEFIRDTFVLRNFTAVEAGYAKVITPRWSPDGTRIAYLKRQSGKTQVWLVNSKNTAGAHQVTSLPDDVVDFAWTQDGNGLIAVSRPALRRQAEAFAKEARGGYLFDERFSPQYAAKPLPTAPIPLEYVHWNLADGASRAASSDEIARLVPTRPAGLPAKARGFAASPSGTLAWSEAKYPDQLLSPSKLVIADAIGRRWICSEKRCEGVSRLWWSQDGQTLYALQRTGWAKSQTALLAWRVGKRAPRQVMVTDDALIGCAKPEREILCAREGAVQPRRLVAIDPETGRERLIHDPNPGFSLLALGTAKRLRFRNVYGVESYADLVLPPGHRQGERHAMVVVQYISDGFLRGGTDDEFPIQALAGKGFAVLSFSRPDFVPAALEAPSELAMRKANRKDWIDRRSVQSSLETAVNLAIATGSVDPDRMGISGFSDGTSTVQWALINSSLFKVAALGACCEDLQAYPLLGGPAFEQFGREMGYRFFETGAEEFWKPMSLVLNADRIDTPILIQTGDSEYTIGLDVVAAWRLRKNPIELYVLDHEGHFKWQPAHRLAIYERATEWFQFWLMGRMNCAGDRLAQYQRWKAMKGAPPAETLTCETGTSPGP